MPRHPAPPVLALGALAAALALLPARDALAQRATAVGNAPTAAATPLAQLMAPWELDATGVARLSADERRALEAWLGRYTAALRAGRPAAPAGGRVELRPAPLDTIRPAPGSRPATEPRRQGERTTRIALSIDPLPNALEVVAVHDGGDLVETEDGSLWETYLPDRFTVGTWRVGQQVVVRGNPLPPQLSGARYDVVLQNGETRTAVGARYAGRQRPEPGSFGAGPEGDANAAP